MAAQGIAGPAMPRPFRPQFGRASHGGPVLAWLLAGLAGLAIIAWAAMDGIWFAPLIIGVIAGVAARFGQWPLRVMAPAVVLMCAAGWGAALIVPAARGLPVGATARTIAGVAGLPAMLVVGVGITLAVSVLQGLAGLWLGRALTPYPARSLALPRSRQRGPGA
jgi:phage shock protein PspC (stress-responsive transcriptional regulator)